MPKYILNVSVFLITGNLCMITGGANLGRVGVVTHRERHPGSFDIIYIKDTLGHSFNTRFVIARFVILAFLFFEITINI